ncbi:hypothetical protein SEA_CECE_185 [Microbacterium phage Cece]|nr:hypothetical protein SEA_CECE_185 [Microbacterium phage Cece]
MSLLDDLYAEERELEARIPTIEDGYQAEVEGVRLAHVRHLIASLEQPYDFGGWEDH